MDPLSYLARVNYAFKSKYLFTGTIRRDGSSRFGPGAVGAFPSVSAGWRLSEEAFMRGLSPVVNDLKLRGSYGLTGNNRFPCTATWACSRRAITCGYGHHARSGTGYAYQRNLSWEKPPAGHWPGSRTFQRESRRYRGLLPQNNLRPAAQRAIALRLRVRSPVAEPGQD